MGRRATPGEVVAAYDETGRKPCRGVWRRGDGEACGLGVLAIKAGIPWPGSWDIRLLGFSKDYVEGFIEGFDGQVLTTIKTDDYQEGLQDGRAAWDATAHLRGSP